MISIFIVRGILLSKYKTDNNLHIIQFMFFFLNVISILFSNTTIAIIVIILGGLTPGVYSIIFNEKK